MSRWSSAQALIAAVAAYDEQGLTAQAIAEALNCSPRTVHRARSRRRVDPISLVAARHVTIAQRFWTKTRIDADCECRLCAATEDAAAKCVIWTASYTGNGYGGFWDGERLVRAHRFAYELLAGAVPEGLQLDHLCRVRMCVAPAHLEPVTQRENVRRGLAGTKGLRGSRDLDEPDTHCPVGHELTAENTYVGPVTRSNPYGQRRCRTCKNAGKRASRARARGRATAGRET